MVNKLSVPVAVDLAKTALATISDVVKDLNKLLNKMIPWQDFREIVDALKKSQAEYSDKAATLIGQVAKLLLDNIDGYMFAVNTVDSWCKSAVELLPTYVELFSKIKEEGVPEAQRHLFLNVLNKGSDVTAKALERLRFCHDRFNAMSIDIDKLRTELDVDFRDDSEYVKEAIRKLDMKMLSETGMESAVGGLLVSPYYILVPILNNAKANFLIMKPELKSVRTTFDGNFERLKNKLLNADKVILAAKEDIDREMDTVRDISTQIDTTTTLEESWALAPPALFEPLKESTRQLIQMCKEYSANVTAKRQTRWAME